MAPHFNEKLTLEEKALAAARYLAGESSHEIARSLGVSQPTAAKAVREMGVSMRDASQARQEHTLCEDYFDSVDTGEKAYWLGFLAADGCVNGNRVSIRLSRHDRSHLVKLACCLGASHPIVNVMTNGGFAQKSVSHQSLLAIVSTRLVAALAQQGIKPRKSLVLEAWAGPAHLLHHYYRGLLDGDGWWSVNARGVWQLGLGGSHETCVEFAAFVTDRTGAEPKRPRPKGKIYTVEYSGLGFLQDLAKILYFDATLCLNRKRELVARLLACRRKIKDHSSLSREKLLGLYAAYKRWGKVAASLGVDPSHLTKLKHRLGIL